MAQGKETPFSQSVIQRAAAGLKYIVSGVTPNSWFGPSQPLQPAAQEQTEGRQFDYAVGQNLRITPRQGEETSFSQLRSLADNYDLVRLLVETRKDQMVKIKWAVQSIDPTQEDDGDPRIAELQAFFRIPDGENLWQSWLRQLLEDMLVIDAATVYPQMSRGGKLLALELVDGATIKRVIDNSGRTPAPPDPAYQQILHGVPAADYTRDTLLYLPRNKRTNRLYGYSPVEQIIMTINIALRRQLSQLQYYTEGSTPDLIFSVPTTWQPSQIKAFEEWWNGVLSGDTAERRKTKFVPDGTKPFNTREPILKDEYDEWLARICCYAFSLPPTPFIKQMNRATAATAQEAALSEGLYPLMQWVKDLMDIIIWKYFGYTDLEFAWDQEEAQDPLQQAQIDDIYVKTGVRSVDEVRQDLGLDPIGMGPAFMSASGPILLTDIINPPEPVEVVAPPVPGTEPQTGEPATKVSARGALAKAKKPLRPINRNRRAVVSQRAALTRTITDFFRTQPALIAHQVTRLMIPVSKADTPDPLSTEAQIEAILAGLKFDTWQSLIPPTEAALSAVATDGGRVALAQVGVQNQPDVFAQVNDLAVQYAKDRAAELVGMKYIDDQLVPNPDAQWQITDSTRSMIRNDVTQAQAEGWSTDTLAAKLEGNYAFSAKRAAMIARTETINADVAGNMTAYRQSGVVTGKQWILGSEHEIDDPCNDNADAGVIGIDDTFPSGDDAPPQHPNCTCDVVPVTGETL